MKTFKKHALFTALAVLVLLSLTLTCLATGLNTESTEMNSSNEATRLLDQGSEIMEMGLSADAIMYFDKAVQIDGQYAVAWFYKALTVETNADRKTSIEKAVLYRNNTNEEERPLREIELTYADNNTDKRIQLAGQPGKLHPENARELLMLADEYQNQGEISKFRDLVYEAIRIEPASPLGYRSLAASWLMNEPSDFSLAEKYMKKFVELRPNDASAHIALGDVYRAYLKLESARTTYSKAIEIEPQSAAALSKRGYVHTYLGMFKEARSDFKKASAQVNQVSNYSTSNASIFSYLDSGNGIVPDCDAEPSQNSQYNSKRLPLNCGSDNCYFCRTFISMFHGIAVSPEESMDVCRCLQHELEVESRVPDETTIEANIAFVEGFRAIQQEDYEKAKQIIGEYVRTISPEIKPQKNEAHNLLSGLVYYNQGNYSKALDSYKKSDTSNIFVRYNLGLTYDKLRRFEEAKIEFTKVAEFNFANACNTQMTKLAAKWLKSFQEASLAQK